MRGERARRAITALGLIAALLLLLGGCDAALCNRTSDCAGGQVCSPAGVWRASAPGPACSRILEA